MTAMRAWKNADLAKFRNLSLVTEITIPRDDCHRWAIRSLLLLRVVGVRARFWRKGNRTWPR